MNHSKGKILVIRGGAIGDFILTLPVFQQLRKYFPQTHLEVLGYPKVAQLAVESGWADACKSIESPGLVRFFAPRGPTPPDWLHYFSQFDIIISYLFDPDQLFQTNVQQAGSHHYIQGPHRPNDNARLHAIDSLLQPLEKLAIYEVGMIPDLSRLARGQTPAEESRVQIAIHPGSGSPSKNWPLERWTHWCQAMCKDSHYHFMIVAGEADREAGETLAGHLPDHCRTLYMNAPLPSVARAIAGSRLFVGHDSGISHLAAALGVPSLVLWGPTNLEVWQPRGKHVTVIESDQGLVGITSRQVSREAHRLMDGRS